MCYIVAVSWWGGGGYNVGMVTNFVGIERDFTVPAGVRADVGIRVKRADGSPAEVGKATWRLGVWKDGAAAVATRFAELLARPAGAGAGDLFWRFPALEAGLWRYEMTATGDDGEVARVFYGVIGCQVASDIVADAEVVGVKGWRMLEVLLPAVAGGKVEAHWLSGDYVLALCTLAQEAAQKAEEMREGIEAALDAAVEEATERAENAAERAEASAESAKQSANSAAGSSTLAAELQANLRARLLQMLKVIDGYLYVDDVNTGHYLKGKDGLQVYISSDGHWYLSDGTYLGWPATGADGVTPHITAEGFWAFGDEVTQYRAIGKDGLDGTAVRRIVVDSFWDIPREGETCNGGFYYYTHKANYHKAHQVTMFYENSGGQPDGKGFYINGVAFEYSGGELSDWADAINAAQGVYNCTAEAVDSEHMVFTALEENGEVAIRTDYTGVYVDVPDTYAVYVWLENANGFGQWTWVGLAYDLATAEVHGVVKLGTDTRVDGGAPVGNNASGQMSVPRSTVSSPGTGKISTLAELTADTAGVVGMNSAGQYLARKADNSHYGTMMYSRTDNYARIISIGEVPMGTKVDGSERGGRLGSTRADANTYGMNKCSYTLTNAADFSDVVYVMPIGMRDDTTAAMVPANIAADNSDPWYFGANGHLAVKLKQDGALQWNSSGQGDRHGVSYSTGGYLWLRTNNSFSQSRADGLSLKEATTSLLGGVRKITTMSSSSNVPTGSAVMTYVSGQLANYYTKSQVYTKAQTEGIIDSECAERVPYYAEQTLAQYAKKSDVNSSVSGKADSSTVNALASTVNANKAATDARVAAAEAKVAALEGKMGQYVKVGNSGIHELAKMEYDEFAALQNRDDDVLYLVLS